MRFRFTRARCFAFVLTAVVFAPGIAVAAPDTPIYPGLKGEYHTYVLSEPIQISASLGGIARAAHYSFHAGGVALKFGSAAHFFGVPGMVALLPEQTFSTPRVLFIEMPSLSYGHLLFRERREIWEKLQELKNKPGIDEVEIVSAGSLEFKGLLAVRHNGRGVVVLHSRAPITSLPGGWGHPIEISGTGAVRLKLSLQAGGEISPVSWDSSFQNAYLGERLPKEIADEWRHTIETAEHVNGADKSQSSVQLLLSVDTPEGTLELGAVHYLEGTKKFLKMGRMSKAVAAVKARLPSGRTELDPFPSLDLSKPESTPQDALPPSKEGRLSVISKEIPWTGLESCLYEALQKGRNLRKKAWSPFTGNPPSP